MLDLLSAPLPEIAAHYESNEQIWVRANMIISQDGHFVGAGDSSRDLTSEADLKLLLLLRALSDVVLVGANTARLENYRQPKARAEFAFLNRKPPRLAVVSASLDFDLTSPLFNGGEEKTIVLNAGKKLPSAELSDIAQVINIDPDEDATNRNFAKALILQLSKLGLRKVTCEGGPSLLAQLLSAGVVDEYDLTISPVTVGGSSLWIEARPSTSEWLEISSAESGEFEFKRLIKSRK